MKIWRGMVDFLVTEFDRLSCARIKIMDITIDQIVYILLLYAPVKRK